MVHGKVHSNLQMCNPRAQPHPVRDLVKCCIYIYLKYIICIILSLSLYLSISVCVCKNMLYIYRMDQDNPGKYDIFGVGKSFRKMVGWYFLGVTSQYLQLWGLAESQRKALKMSDLLPFFDLQPPSFPNDGLIL